MQYIDYVKEVERIYKIERRETYYYVLLVNFLRECITDNDKMLVSVWDNKGYKDDGVKIHNRNAYADSHSLQDMIIVPSNYEYENTQKPYVSIELKKPNLDNYHMLDLNGNMDQIDAELGYSDFIIYTDCVTWIFVQKERKPKIISLMKNNKWIQLKKSSNKRVGNVIYEEPDKWCELIELIKDFIASSEQKTD